MQNPFSKNISAIILTLLIIEIFLFSSIPGNSFKGETFPNAIAYHFIIFFLFNFFVLSSINPSSKKYFSIAIILSITQSLLDEFHQLFIFGRSASLNDVLIDISGILISSLIWKLKFAKTINKF